MLYLIYTTDLNNQIGDDTLFQKTCKEDKNWFIKVTKHHKLCLVGKNTAQTLPTLQDREVVVLGRDTQVKNGIIIGGKMIYEAFWDKADVIYRSIHKQVNFGGLKFEPDFTNFVLFEKTETEELIKEIWIRVPAFSRQIKYRYENNIYMGFAKCVSDIESLDKKMPLGCLFVNNGQVITYGANGSDFHEKREKEMLAKDPTYSFGGCVRQENHIPSGQNYEMCEGCDTKNHGEPSAINKIVNTPKFDLLQNSVCYMHGHYYCCQSCLSKMEKLGVREIVISKDFVTKFFGIYLEADSI